MNLLVLLFEAYPIKPDMLSIECDINEGQVIRFKWVYGRKKDFPYSRKNFDAIWKAFHGYWLKQNREGLA
jgi:hypothetical protein